MNKVNVYIPYKFKQGIGNNMKYNRDFSAQCRHFSSKQTNQYNCDDRNVVKTCKHTNNVP